MPTFEELAREIARPPPSEELARPEHLWGSVLISGVLLDHALLNPTSGQRQHLLGFAELIERVVGKALFDRRVKKGSEIEDRFVGMLEVTARVRRRLGDQ
ncbi:MAG: hypothetical protein OXU75_11160 [Deltaproteobacteria bacterium]|nr:hypothetical protein [Deltaproteobacteria bacterium]